jgi:catechol 2,3-dioxygenase-like lactoylglutathione lyase family enzyme
MKLVSLNHLQHIGIPVTDIRTSEGFYKSLGFSNVMEASFDHGEAKGLCIMMRHGSIVVELYQMPDSVLKSVHQRKDGHIDHIAFDVSDIDATFKILKESGFTILEEAPVFLKFWKNGCRYFNIVGPDGERLEFNQIL